MPGARRRIYLDHNATAPLDPRVRAAVIEALDACRGNPSSIHQEGREARERVEVARRQVAGLVGGDPDEIVFTSGGTEADHLGVTALYRLGRARGLPARVLVAPIEHPAVLGAVAALPGAEVARLRVDEAGQIDLDHLERALAGGAALVAVAAANHELGTVQDVAAIARLCGAAGALLHVDAVQAAGRLAIDARALGADALAVSGHKIHGPPGAGALWVRREHVVEPVHTGGHQERERRPGTENLPGIVGLGAAAAIAAGSLEEVRAHLAAVGGALEDGVAALPGARIHARGAPRVPGVTSAAFDGAPGELVVQALDLAGVAASTGAACTSGTVAASPVLLALGLSRARALEAVRLSAGRGTTPEEVGAVLELLPGIVERIRRFA
ncbi:MAG TPA: cysteine desulfurase family protein [Kofleriaceae bacterium]|nr:cysteine desulfurase family protein [Kofleriaceae bacterium]